MLVPTVGFYLKNHFLLLCGCVHTLIWSRQGVGALGQAGSLTSTSHHTFSLSMTHGTEGRKKQVGVLPTHWLSTTFPTLMVLYSISSTCRASLFSPFSCLEEEEEKSFFCGTYLSAIFQSFLYSHFLWLYVSFALLPSFLVFASSILPFLSLLGGSFSGVLSGQAPLIPSALG